MTNLRITEIFYSLQGEAKTVGLPTVFIRLTGCPLRCSYCDTAYAFSGGEIQTLQKIMTKVASYKPRYITVTGGEPLAQRECLTLLTALCNEGYLVSLETSGSMDIEAVDERVSIVMDLKAPESGEVAKNRYANVELLGSKDQIKFVLCNQQDYEWARFKLDEYDLIERVGEVLFSASHGELDTTQLADWIIQDRLLVRLQVQLHKYLWGDKPGV
ncbi:MAG: 7-carboxy-7-deazaguanine synthase QueE [Pseudomonadales bacterium]|nr:7-carboxy-7-deazaguanine synthase QueE [Pseudomonadales bacterium]